MLDTFLIPTAPIEGEQTSLKPIIRVIESDDTYGKVAVEPLQRGFGLTIGNPMRRILLSSTKGSAITWVKIEDVVHEYTAIQGIKEEVMELLLNIKRIRIRAQSNRPGKMRLDVTGEGRVCAGDISTSSDFEIVNPQLHLATLDSQDSQLSIEFNVEQGVGYQRAPQLDDGENPPLGVLPLDAIFNPVRKVNYDVKRTRVGQVTDYERLELEVWTDGTIKPVEAVREAADHLVNHFFLFTNLDRAVEAGTERPPLSVSPEVYQTPIERLELSPRTLNCLKRAHINKVGEVLEMTDEELVKIRNFGEKSLKELKEKLEARGLTHREDGAVAAADGNGLEALAAVVAEDLSAADLGELMGDDSVTGTTAPTSKELEDFQGEAGALDATDDDDDDWADDEEEEKES